MYYPSNFDNLYFIVDNFVSLLLIWKAKSHRRCSKNLYILIFLNNSLSLPYLILYYQYYNCMLNILVPRAFRTHLYSSITLLILYKDSYYYCYLLNFHWIGNCYLLSMHINCSVAVALKNAAVLNAMSINAFPRLLQKVAIKKPHSDSAILFVELL